VAVLAFFSFMGDSPAGFPFALAWLAHIAVDRASGYGLRDKQGWQRHTGRPVEA
jgi:hypothetical protein